MTNIKEYFNNMYKATTTTEEYEAVMEYEDSIYELFEEGTEKEVEAWATEQGVSLTATQVVLGSEELVTTLWAWDMCGE